MTQNLHGLEDFFTAVTNNTLPPQGGVYWVKGGYTNIFNLNPANPDPKVQANFKGDDDHPGYSDAQVSEAMVAKGINAIANSSTGLGRPSSSHGTTQKAITTTCLLLSGASVLTAR